jgi:DNA-binding MarR family transcriptional regulator
MQLLAPPISVTAIEAFRRDLRVVEREVVRQMQVETACCGVTLAQCHVLLQLGQAGSLSLRDLVEGLGLDKSTLSRTVDGMVKAGLVLRVVDPADRRAVRLTCTRTGSAKVASIDEACNRKYAALLSRASAAERRQIVGAVRFLAEAMRENRGIGDDEASACCAVPLPVSAAARAPALVRSSAPKRPAQLSATATGRRHSRKDM